MSPHLPSIRVNRVQVWGCLYIWSHGESTVQMRSQLVSIFGKSVWPAVITAVIAVLVAAFAGAILLYDGAWFLFALLDTHRIEIPQLRISFALMQWPAIWVAEATESVPLTRFVFSLVVMAMPPISIALCWWIVRKSAPWLIIWPAIGIFLVDLPGQMHWIATSIRTNQLFWPILMAILVGIPTNTIPALFILFVFALFMHPQVSVYFMAGACAAAYLAWLQPEHREKLRSAAILLVFGALFRYGILSGGYEQQEASFDNQIGQWQRSVLWLPLILLVSALAVAIFVWLKRHYPGKATRGRNGNVLLAALALPGVICIIIWATDATLWKTAIDYRGPSLWHSLIVMGIAFLDAAWPRKTEESAESTALRLRLSNYAAVLFCVVIALQSFTWDRELDKVRNAMAGSDGGCIAAETLPGFEDSPLNFWSLPPASIGLQSTEPNFVVLPGHLCETAITTGVIPMDLTNPGQDRAGRFVNMFHLRTQVLNSAICWSAYQAGWHDLEVSGSGTRRWSNSNGVVVVMMNEAGPVSVTGVLDSLQTPNEIKLRVNGNIQRSYQVGEDRYTDLAGTTIQLQEGANLIEFVSMRPPAMAEGDPRELTIAVVNLEFRIQENENLCSWQTLPPQYEDLGYQPNTGPANTGNRSRGIQSTPAASPAATPVATPTE